MLRSSRHCYSQATALCGAVRGVHILACTSGREAVVAAADHILRGIRKREKRKDMKPKMFLKNNSPFKECCALCVYRGHTVGKAFACLHLHHRMALNQKMPRTFRPPSCCPAALHFFFFLKGEGWILVFL